jgi:bifunctional non-homologous end joining protein LigD
LDGYRAIAFKSGCKIHLRSRNDNDFSARYPAIAKALEGMPDESVIDGEIVALDGDGRPSFNLLQNSCSSKTPLYYAPDVMVPAGEDVMGDLETGCGLDFLSDALAIGRAVRALTVLDAFTRESPAIESTL